jgi:hypothetical protein
VYELIERDVGLPGRAGPLERHPVHRVRVPHWRGCFGGTKAGWWELPCKRGCGELILRWRELLLDHRRELGRCPDMHLRRWLLRWWRPDMHLWLLWWWRPDRLLWWW